LKGGFSEAEKETMVPAGAAGLLGLTGIQVNTAAAELEQAG
jgi:hypothetical protein